MNWRVVLFNVNFDQSEFEAVRRVLESGWLSVGAETAAFEQEFAAALGAADAVAVSSGTAALHIAAHALDLKPGDEVIMPALGFVASAAVVALAGARPVFCEVKGPHDLTADPGDIARRITPRTRAILVVHYAGYPADMAAIGALARRHDLAVIEDAAHAPLVKTGQGTLGTLGDIGCFSFFATKNLSTGEGGMLVARDPKLLARARALRAHCMTTSSWEKHQGRPSAYDVVDLGFNYRPTEITSAIGRVQLRKLDYDRRRRAELVRAYHRALANLDSITLPFEDHSGDSAYHLFPIVLAPHIQRPALQEYLKQAGIQSSVHYPPMHLFSYYRKTYGYQEGDLPISEDLAARELTLPLHTRMSDTDVDLVADTLRLFLRQARV